MGVLHGHADQAQHSLMVGIIEAVQLLVLPVNGQCVLGQIIGTEAEEFHFLCQLVADDGRRRRLHHDSQLHIAEGLSFRRQFPLYAFHDSLDLPDFLRGNDHGEHDRRRTVCGSPVNCAELCLKDILSGQADTDRPVAHGGIFLLRQVKITNLLVRSDIQRSDNDLLSSHSGKNFLINLKLLFFGGIVLPAEIDKFASEQTDSACIRLKDLFHILHAADIGIDVDSPSV